VNLEVRCCCDPEWVFGYVEVPDDQAVPGFKVRFPLGRVIAGTEVSACEILELEVDTVTKYRDDTRISWLALKSRDYPIEKLRRIRGFVERLRC
jgi:hypothetical protein